MLPLLLFTHCVHYSLCPLGLLGAPPAMPLLNGPALSTALLQLALQTQSQKVTSGLWDTGSLTHIPQPLMIPFPALLLLPMGSLPSTSCGPSDCVPGGLVRRCSGSDLVKAKAPQGNRRASRPHPLNTHTEKLTYHTQAVLVVKNPPANALAAGLQGGPCLDTVTPRGSQIGRASCRERV